MTEFNYIECSNIYPNLGVPLNSIPLNAIPLNVIPLSNEQQFRLKKKNEIKDYFVAEIKERELISKGVSKYITSFDYFDRSLMILSGTTGSISIASFLTAIEAPVGMVTASLAFLISTGMIKKLLKTTRNQKKTQ